VTKTMYGTKDSKSWNPLMRLAGFLPTLPSSRAGQESHVANEYTNQTTDTKREALASPREIESPHVVATKEATTTSNAEEEEPTKEYRNRIVEMDEQHDKLPPCCETGSQRQQPKKVGTTQDDTCMATNATEEQEQEQTRKKVSDRTIATEEKRDPIPPETECESPQQKPLEGKVNKDDACTAASRYEEEEEKEKVEKAKQRIETIAIDDGEDENGKQEQEQKETAELATLAPEEGWITIDEAIRNTIKELYPEESHESYSVPPPLAKAVSQQQEQEVPSTIDVTSIEPTPINKAEERKLINRKRGREDVQRQDQKDPTTGGLYFNDDEQAIQKAHRDHRSITNEHPVAIFDKPIIEKPVKKRGKNASIKNVSDKIEKLDCHIGKLLVNSQKIWESMFAELVTHRRLHNNCYVVNKTPLGQWVDIQRLQYKHGSLPPDRFERLNTLGLVWDRDASEWMEKFQMLSTFKARFRTTNVPKIRDILDDGLADWVKKQRKRYKAGLLDEKRIYILKSIGFVFDAKPLHIWSRMYDKLVHFKSRYDSTDVPIGWEEDPDLGLWVLLQRYRHEIGNSPDSQVKRLRTIGFRFRFEKKEREAFSFRYK